MNKSVLQLGVVGLRRGMDVATTVIGDENVHIRAICDIDKAQMQLSREKLEKAGVTDFLCFDSYDDFLASDIDAVYIANYATEHVPFAIKALDAGKHVLSEIPSVYSVEQARDLKAAVKAHPELKFMAGENCCYWAFIQAWKSFYDDGRFGDIVYAESEYLYSGDFRKLPPLDENHWRTHMDAIRYLTHNLGPLLYIMNDRCVSVTCMQSDFVYHPGKKGKQASVALFRTEKGAIIRILINFGAYVGFDHNYRIQGTRGSIATENSKSFETAHSFASFSDIPGSLEQKIDIPVTTAFAGEPTKGHGGADMKMLRTFIKCVLNDTPVPLDADFAINISLPGIYAQESAEKGSIPIEIPLI